MSLLKPKNVLLAPSIILGLSLSLSSGCSSEEKNTCEPNCSAIDTGPGDSTTMDASVVPDTFPPGSVFNDAGLIQTPDGALFYPDGAPYTPDVMPPKTCSSFNEDCLEGSTCCSGLCDLTTKKCASSIAVCRNVSEACAVNTDCCNLNCVSGFCAAGACIADGQSCKDGQGCCSGQCSNGTCQKLDPVSTCSTAGNPCTGNDTCCSKLCKNNTCALGASFCIQTGDICASGNDCCSGVCNKKPGASVGTCGAPPTGASNCNGKVDGTVCGGDCNECCSRLCAPFGPSGVKVCQPANGCRPTGGLCRKNADCCGGDKTGLPGEGTVQCDLSAGGPVGICNNGQKCTAPGAVCHYKGGLSYVCESSSAPNSCCDYVDAGPGISYKGTCIPDSVGVPRCTAFGTPDGGIACRSAGDVCAFSAECCNNAPCVRDSQGVLRCAVINPDGGLACVNQGGSCTVNADCCLGTTCIASVGSTSGTCGVPTTPKTDAGGMADSTTDSTLDGTVPPSDGGPVVDSAPPGTDSAPLCVDYGGACRAGSDCCNGVPCGYLSSTCQPGQLGCTCHYIVK